MERYKKLSNEDQEDLQQLKEDLKRLDDQSEEYTKKMTIYKNSRFIFLLQSTLLGMSYSMIWPTVYTYIRDDFLLQSNSAKLVYGITYVSYPAASMLSAYLVERMHCSTKKTILILNSFEIIGNLIYTLNYFPFLPCLGRFIAGLGDAFYVILMKEMKSKYGNKISERVTIECLAAFIIGVIIAPGINILTTFINFHLGYWLVNPNNFPGLTVAVLFLLAQLIILFILPDDGHIPDTKLEETDSDSSIGLTHFVDYSVMFVEAFSFLYTYIVAMLELLFPIIIYEMCKFTAKDAMLIYAVMGTMYAIILMFTMTASFNNPLETYLCVTVFMQVVSLLSVVFMFIYGDQSMVWKISIVVVIVLALATMWSIDDILFINMVHTLVTFEYRLRSHGLRKVMSRFAFCIAGVTAPFYFGSAFTFVGPITIVLVFFLFCYYVVLKYSFQNHKQ